MWREHIVALDLETTSPNPRSARIIELALTDYSKWEWDTLVDPEVSLMSKITEVTSIRESDLMGAPKLQEVLPYVLSKIGSRAIVAHNGLRYDKTVLECEAKRVGIATPEFRVIDTLTIARHVWPEMPNHKLGTLVDQLGIKHGQLHGALEDAKCCLEILERAVEKVGCRWIDDVLNLQAQPKKIGATPGFGKYKNCPWDMIPESYLQWYCYKCDNPDPDVVEHMKKIILSRLKVSRRK